MGTINKINSLSELGLSKDLIHEFILKGIYSQGALSGKQIGNLLKLSFNILEEELESLKKRELIGVTGSVSGLGGYSSMVFDLTTQGRKKKSTREP